MTAPEPPGARIQVVKGFAALTWDGIHPHLPSRDRRDAIIGCWPRWDGRAELWRFRYAAQGPVLGEPAEYADYCRLALAPNGDATLLCYDRDGDFIADREERFEGEGDEPILAMFLALARAWGPAIAAHLAAVTTRPP